MLHKARNKFVIWAMLAMIVSVVVLIAAVNVVNWYNTDRRLNSALQEIAAVDETGGRDTADSSLEGGLPDEMDSAFPDGADSAFSGELSGFEGPDGDTDGGKGGHHGRESALVQYASRYFAVLVTSDGTAMSLQKGQSVAADSTTQALADSVEASGRTEGYLDDYKYLVTEKGDGQTLIYFLDCTTDLTARKSLILTSVGVGILGLLLSFLFILRMSGQVVQPVAESMEKQKRFITDAGHELKTPLSVIATNMDILTMDLGENEWVDGTKKQVGKLRKLVANLISLSKLDEEDTALELQYFSLTDAVIECIDSFEGLAELSGKTLSTSIGEHLTVQGDPSTVQQLVSILCDNAIKYAAGDAPIEIRLYGEGKKVVFETANDWDRGEDPAELDRLFDRFYRSDVSRSGEDGRGGYGLGLSIARAIAEKNHAQIAALEDKDHRLVFRVTFRKLDK